MTESYNGLDCLHCRGIISSPRLESEKAVEDWLDAHCDGGQQHKRFQPAFTGKDAVQLLPQPINLGRFRHLNKDYHTGGDQEINWNVGIIIRWVNWVYGIVPTKDGFVAVINANFRHAIVVEAAPEPPPASGGAGAPIII